MTGVFVSHASADTTFAEQLSDDLRALGVDVWLDSSHMGPGDFVSRISAALQRDVLILVLTPAALASAWVQQEMNAAITRANQRLMRSPIVVLAAPCAPEQIPALWTVYHRYDAIREYQSTLTHIAQELGVAAPSTPAKSAAPAASASPVVTPAQRPSRAAPPPLDAPTHPHSANAAGASRSGAAHAVVNAPMIASTPATPATLAAPVTGSTVADTSNRAARAYWALAGGAAIATVLALMVRAYFVRTYPQDQDPILLGTLALAAQSAAVCVASIVSLVSARYRVRYRGLLAVCLAALGLDTYLRTRPLWNWNTYVPLDQIPYAIGYALIALALLAIVYWLRMGGDRASLPRRTWIAIYGATMAAFGGVLAIQVRNFGAWPPPIVDSYPAMALLGLVYAIAMAIARRQWRWVAAVSLTAFLTYLSLLLFGLLHLQIFSSTEGLPSVIGIYFSIFPDLLALAPLLYALFADTRTSLRERAQASALG